MKQSIYSLIHTNLKKMLAATLSVSALLVLVYTGYSFKQTENQAARFVMKHVERLAQAGVTSQTVGDVDNEVARFFQTWKDTQDLDLRIDIYLNDRSISHAGQLQPFGYFSTSTERRLSLPSGDTLRVAIQFELTELILYSIALLMVLEGGIVALFYVLRKSMQTSIRSVTQPLESQVAWLKKIAGDLPQSARTEVRPGFAGIQEIDDLSESITSLTRQIVALEDNLAKVNFDRGRLKMAEQVAHSIKGAIATLQLRAGEVSGASERQGLLDCIKTLSEISEKLLKAKRASAEAARAFIGEPSHILPAIRSAVAAKCEQYQERANVNIQLTGEAAAIHRFVQIEEADLQAIIFSVIDNAVEALPPSGGEVAVEISSSQTSLEIRVRDNGRGVPEHILPSLMVEGFSYNKKNGNGIGLSHAKEIVEAAAGTISIDSKEDAGTVVTMQLPLEKPTDTDIRVISIPTGTTVVCVDDQEIVHSSWDYRLKSAGPIKPKTVHLHSVEEFDKWIAEHGNGEFGSRLYLFDYDLKNEKKTGIDLIAEHGLALESILVSGMTENKLLKERTAKMGLRRLSKDFLSVVPIHVEEGTSLTRLNAGLAT